MEELEGIQKELEMSTGHNLQSSGTISRRAKSVPASMLTERSARKEVIISISNSLSKDFKNFKVGSLEFGF